MIAKIVVAALMTCDPALATLFTPRHAQLGRYEVCTTADAIETVIAGGGLARPDTSIEALESLEAFGGAGSYDRSRLARLYGGNRVRVARGWTESDGRFESVTLLSPYPDASLTHLNSGTMVIRWTLQRSTQNPQNTRSETLSAGSASSAFNVVTR
jgi:hypothetical protein